MRFQTLLIFSFLCLLMARQDVSYAVTVADTVLFGNPLTITDTQSGNAANFSYKHLFENLDLNTSHIRSGQITLKHEGNANEGPRRELWTLLDGNGIRLGVLSSSLDSVQTDSFQLPLGLLTNIGPSQPAEWMFQLAEETSFNGEKIGLYGSVMELDVSTRTDQYDAPNMPEPATGALIGLGLIGIMLRRRLNTA